MTLPPLPASQPPDRWWHRSVNRIGALLGVGALAEAVLLVAGVSGAELLVVPTMAVGAAVALGRPRPLVEPAVAAALSARERRTRARILVASDPALARELSVGRPGVGDYDDGGLLDLNSCGTGDLVDLGLSQTEAAAVLEVRASRGRLFGVEDLVVHGPLSSEAADLLRERAVFL